MVQINWQGRSLNVRRLVHSTLASPQLTTSLARIARLRQLAVADDRSDPTEGDFWIACWPGRGWGDTDHRTVHLALGLEAPLVLALLERVADRPDEKSDQPLLRSADLPDR
jgi:hypothetical protein